MKLEKLGRCIDISVGRKPPKKLLDICDGYYHPYYYLMYLLSRHTEGLRVELGVEKARGLVAMAMGNSYKCIGFDNNLLDEAKTADREIAHIEAYHMPSLPVPMNIVPLNSIGILHIDTEHSYSMANAEFDAYEPHLLPGAVVLFDDLHAQEDGVLQYFSELPYPKIQDDRLHPVCGYGVLIYE